MYVRFCLATCVLASATVAVVACSSSSSTSPTDSGTPDVTQSHDSGHSPDAGQPHDASKDVSTDRGHEAASADAGIGKTCGQLLLCDQPCSSNACTNACYAESTGVAQGLFNALSNCINVNCSADAGGPCASSSSTACSNCETAAATGACISNLDTCEQDTHVGPPDTDGGGVVVPHNDAGPELNCGEYIACVAACPLDAGVCGTTCGAQATPEAKALAGTLNGCLTTACPSTDGGPCATQGTACSGCVAQAELAIPNVCATPFDACETDRSNSPDASTTPTPLSDGGILTTVVSGIDQPGSALAVRGGYLYFAPVVGDSQVTRVALADGGAQTLLGPALPTPVGLVVDSNNAYAWCVGSFTGTSSLNNSDGTVVQIPLAGGAAITLGQGTEVEYDAPYLNSIAVDPTYVYWVAGANGNDGAIMRATIGSQNAAPLYSQQFLPEAVTTDGTNVYWANWGTFDAQGHSNNDGAVLQGPVAGGTPLTLASNLSPTASIAVDAHNVYWTDLGPLGGDNLPAPNSGAVKQVPIGGGTIVTLASAEPIPIGIAVAGSTVYWAEYALSAPGLILSAPVGGGTVVPLAAGLADPFELTISGNTVYWTNTPSSNGQGTILSLTPL